ncbi:MAG: tripartite tricarboxylate transporter TctB family protein [Rhodobacteraceae bacterium]|nr:tripartite tricarboxylate transporter TctB family protein [Paracoccaceae bacterium]
MTARAIRINQPDLVAGIMFLVVGFIALWELRDLHVGTLQEMGPAYFPRALAFVLVAIGLYVGARSFRGPMQDLGRFNIRATVLIVSAVLVFAVTVNRIGYVPGAALLVAISSFADTDARMRQVAVSIVCLVVFTAAIFIGGLGVQLPLIRGF